MADAAGHELVHEFVAPKKAIAWIRAQGERVALSDAQVEERLARAPDDVDLLRLQASRARARGDLAAARGWLERVERADRSEGKEAAAAAAWQRIELDLRESVAREVRARVLPYLERYPAQGEPAARLLAATGAPREQVEGAYARVAAAAPEAQLNGLAYAALGAGALDAALAAAKRQLEPRPDDPGLLDTLAEVLSYRGERERALEVQRRALASPELPPDLAAGLRLNLQRFEHGLPSPDVRPPGLDGTLAPRRFEERADPVRTATRFFEHETAVLAACHGRGLERVAVRIEVAGAGRPARVELLEPGASPGLRRCVEEALGALALPAESLPASLLLTLPIPPPAPPRPEAQEARKP